MPTLGGIEFEFREAGPEDWEEARAFARELGELQSALIEGPGLVVAREASSGTLAAYTAYRLGTVEGWDMQVTAVAVVEGFRGIGLYRALNVWTVRAAPPETTVCAYVDDPVTEHVVTTQWNPHVSRVCADGSRFYGTMVEQVER